MLDILKKYVYLFLTLFLFTVYIQYKITAQRYLFTQDMVGTIAPICAKSALRNFQEESNMSAYTADGSSGMSSCYSNYLGWLGSIGEFSEIASDLSNGFTEGINPTNYALPYVDAEKLTPIFNSLFSQQLENFTDNTYCDIVSINGSVTSAIPVVYDSSNATTWGINSSFYNNDTGEEKIYDYNKMVSYKVNFHIDVGIRIKYGFTGIVASTKHYIFDMPMVYELMN